MAQYNGVWSSMDFSWRREEKDREWEEHASAQLCRIPDVWVGLETYSCTRSRTSPRTVFRTSRAVRASAEVVKENQLAARAFPLVLAEGEVGDLGG